MNVRLRERLPFRSSLALAMLTAAGCASFGQPAPEQWPAGSYPFDAALDGLLITGTVEVEPQGPAAVTTSLGACLPDLGQSYRPWSRSRTFLCSGDHRMVVNVGTRVGPPITGTISNWRTVTRYETVERCVRRVFDAETGESPCVQWVQEQRAVDERVGGSVRISLVDSEEPAGRR